MQRNFNFSYKWGSLTDIWNQALELLRSFPVLQSILTPIHIFIDEVLESLEGSLYCFHAKCGIRTLWDWVERPRPGVPFHLEGWATSVSNLRPHLSEVEPQLLGELYMIFPQLAFQTRVELHGKQNNDTPAPPRQSLEPGNMLLYRAKRLGRCN